MDHDIPRPGLFVLYPAGRVTDGLLIFKVIQQIIIDSKVCSHMLIRPKAIIKFQRLEVLNFRTGHLSHGHTDPTWPWPPLGTCTHYTDLQRSLCSSSTFRQCVFWVCRLLWHGFTEEELLLNGHLQAIQRPGNCVCLSWCRKATAALRILCACTQILSASSLFSPLLT